MRSERTSSHGWGTRPHGGLDSVWGYVGVKEPKLIEFPTAEIVAEAARAFPQFTAKTSGPPANPVVDQV